MKDTANSFLLLCGAISSFDAVRVSMAAVIVPLCFYRITSALMRDEALDFLGGTENLAGIGVGNGSVDASFMTFSLAFICFSFSSCSDGLSEQQRDEREFLFDVSNMFVAPFGASI